MDFIKEILAFLPKCEQEERDKKNMLGFINHFNSNVLFRDNEIAHITSSGFIMNPELTKVLLVHHNIMNIWAWTGGHADGDPDLLHVAIKEAKEETGVREIRPLQPGAASLDILPVFGHRKNGRYVSSHLHLSVAYLLVCDESQALHIKPDENTEIDWFNTDYFTKEHFNDSDVHLYTKLIARAREIT